MTDTTDTIQPAGGSPIECSCCFETFSAVFMHFAFCPARHPFCRSCIRKYADTQLAAQNPDLKCMHISGCELPFTISELNTHLTKDQIKLRDRVHLRRDLREAKIPNLASCPSCDWAAIIESCKTRYPVARCWNVESGCGVVFCRTCERKDHRPRTCEEETRRLAGREVVADAMTKAVVRVCPGCKSQFMKEAGCNLMTCPNCQTKSCYVCRKVVENRYNHFRNNQRQLNAPSLNNKCPLFDVDQPHIRHAREADAAGRQAFQRLTSGNRAIGNVNNLNPTANAVAGPSRIPASQVMGPGPHNYYVQPPRPHRPLNLNLNPYAAVPLVPPQPNQQYPPLYRTHAPFGQYEYPLPNAAGPLPVPLPHQGELPPEIAPIPAFPPAANPGYEQNPWNANGPIAALPFALIPVAAPAPPSLQPYQVQQPMRPRARQEHVQGGGIHWHHGHRQRAAPYNHNARHAHPNAFYPPTQADVQVPHHVEEPFSPIYNPPAFDLRGAGHNANAPQGPAPAYAPVEPQLHHQVRPGVPHGYGGFGLQAEFGGARTVENQHDWFLRALERVTRGAGAM